MYRWRAVNKAAVNHIRADLDMINDYLHTLCPGHKVELSIEEAFKTVPLNADTEKDLNDIYYFFKKADCIYGSAMYKI